MGTYGDSMMIAFYVVVTVAAIGAFLVLGMAAETLVRTWSSRPARPTSPKLTARFAH